MDELGTQSGLDKEGLDKEGTDASDISDLVKVWYKGTLPQCENKPSRFEKS